MSNLEDYILLLKNATIGSGISCQLQAFRLGFNQVFPIEHLRVFSEEELELILCGEPNSWTFNDLLKHFKFDHGYTARSPPIMNVSMTIMLYSVLLEILQEFNNEERRAFVQFVTRSPRLPPGGLASLDPKLTVVQKISYNHTDTDLPSVMTCANYLKLPPYSSKERMKQKLLYAITEGRGCFLFS
ncbi:putative aminoacyltransferase, E1 ubiquitin-activating enzyme [Medicago truncatula]|uniref:Putative aminoacyltransferase, E1 ubiquitin-activating enzyme n=1 Tax=Medicago truncatula TaxID=3880 RepID=A0A396HBW7_MEDTR|nr:putative aminoacyltransferase, E1 ubiquitin-activating enzyme [Medicago truncatula]